MIQLLPILLTQVALMAGGPVSVQCKPALVDSQGKPADGVAYATERRIELNAEDV